MAFEADEDRRRHAPTETCERCGDNVAGAGLLQFRDGHCRRCWMELELRAPTFIKKRIEKEA